MAGMGIIWERWGKLKWNEIVAPSLKLLADGFTYGSTARAIGALERTIRKYPPTAKHLMPEGKVPNHEDIWHRQAAVATRMHVEMSEPVEITQAAGDSLIDALRGMGHEIKAQRAIAGDMNCAEVLKDTNSVRAGGNAWAAG
jgi:gamma-glutamyltranspeptidase